MTLTISSAGHRITPPAPARRANRDPQRPPQAARPAAESSQSRALVVATPNTPCLNAQVREARAIRWARAHARYATQAKRAVATNSAGRALDICA